MLVEVGDLLLVEKRMIGLRDPSLALPGMTIDLETGDSLVVLGPDAKIGDIGWTRVLSPKGVLFVWTRYADRHVRNHTQEL
jgi:hypothetical protein